MNVLDRLERRKHDLRLEMVRLKQQRKHDMLFRVYEKLCEIKRAEKYLRRA